MKKLPDKIKAHFIAGLMMVLAGLIFTATLVWGPARLASAQMSGPSWSYTGNLISARLYHTATLLPNGKVLVAGGMGVYNNANSIFNSAELYDPATGTWSHTGNLNTARAYHTATLLPNGNVLVAGDDSAELYDSATGIWHVTGNLNTDGYFQTATLLPNGKVLVAGGYLDHYRSAPLTRAELYDPATGTWSLTGFLNIGRWLHTATLLPNGKVLVAGGNGGRGGILNSAELYDPATGTWSLTGDLNTARTYHTATLLPNGKVLLTGGDVLFFLSSAELYDPATGTWSITGNPNSARDYNSTATLLPNGKVLVAAGSFSGDGITLNDAELYDPTTGMWNYTDSLNSAREDHTMTLLPNGKVLVAGGDGNNYYTLNSAELYDPGTNSIPNQIDDAQFFIRQHYLDFLNREPDSGGLAYWTARITDCGSDAHCIHDRRIGVSAAFFIEQEFQDTGYYVYRFYKASFGRPPSFAEFMPDRNQVSGGTNLEESKQAFADQWAQRPAFVAAFPITLSNTEVGNKLFDSAGLTGSSYDSLRQQEIQAMNAGRSRALVLRDVIEIPDFKNTPDPNGPRYSELKQISQYNPAFVLMQYFGYLRRDVDQGGYDFWLDVVNNREPNNYRGMVCAFITATEYQLRFGSAATRSNADCAR